MSAGYWARLVALIVPTAPTRIALEQYRRSSWAVLLHAVSLGLQATVTLMTATGPLAAPPVAEDLTLLGQVTLNPSYDLRAYSAGCLLTVLLMYLSVRLWSALLGRPGLVQPARAATPGPTVCGLLAVAGLALYLVAIDSVRLSFSHDGMLPVRSLLRLCAPALLSLLAVGGGSIWLVAASRRPHA